MHIRDERTVKAQAVSGLWLAAKAVMGIFIAMVLVRGFALLRSLGDSRPDSPSGRNVLIWGTCFLAALAIVILAAVRWLNSPARIIRISDSFYLPVRSLEVAGQWYRDKLGLKNVAPHDDDEPGATAALALEKESGVLTLGLIDPGKAGADEAGPSVPTLYARNINKAREWLGSRGVATGPIRSDSQRTRYFEFRDLDGNLLEVSEEP